MPAPLIGAIVGGIAGAVGGGVSSYINNKKLANAYKGYAKDVREAAEKYSGRNADMAMTAAGDVQAQQMNNSFMPRNQVNTSNIGMQNALRNANNLQDYSMQGQQMGRANKASDLNAKYNAATAKAQQGMKQAGIEYQVNNQLAQGLYNTAGNIAQTYNTIRSDERAKEYNNHNNLPKADAADALRQIESIQYQYKDGLGPQDGRHVGVTAQSLEGTAFDDVVREGKNGYKELDKNKLLESLVAGIAALQKELDEVENR